MYRRFWLVLWFRGTSDVSNEHKVFKPSKDREDLIRRGVELFELQNPIQHTTWDVYRTQYSNGNSELHVSLKSQSAFKNSYFVTVHVIFQNKHKRNHVNICILLLRSNILYVFWLDFGYFPWFFCHCFGTFHLAPANGGHWHTYKVKHIYMICMYIFACMPEKVGKVHVHCITFFYIYQINVTNNHDSLTRSPRALMVT